MVLLSITVATNGAHRRRVTKSSSSVGSPRISRGNPLSSQSSSALSQLGVVDWIIDSNSNGSNQRPSRSPIHNLYCTRSAGGGCVTAPDYDTSRSFSLPPQLIFGTMLFLDLPSLLELRAVCRSFNDVFLTYNIQRSFAATLPRPTHETTTWTITLTEVMRSREAILRHREQGWSRWLTVYMAAKLRGLANENDIRNMKLKGKYLHMRLQRARESYRCATKEWFGYWADSSRAQHNIRRNWFNHSSLSCKIYCGIYPIILPDGTLCINDPADTVIFYVRRDHRFSACMAQSAKESCTSSRTSEMLREIWFPFRELLFKSLVTHMCYDPYMDVLHIGVGSDITMWRVESGVVVNLKRRLELEAEREESSSLPNLWVHDTVVDRSPSDVVGMGSYTIAKEHLDTFLPLNRDMIGLPDYEWSETEILAKSRAQSRDGGDHDDDRCRIVVAKRERDATAALSHALAALGGTPLTKYDIAELRFMLQEMADTHGSSCNSENSSRHSSASIPISSFRSNTSVGRCSNENSILLSETLELSDGSHANTGNRTTEVPLCFQDKTEKEEEEDTNASARTSAGTMATRHVFAVFNERAVLACASCTTREVAFFILSPHTCVTLGVGCAVDIRNAHILSVSMFRPSQSTSTDSVDECEALFACRSHHSIIIYQQLILRQIEEIEKFVLGEETVGGVTRECGTWYFLKGYSYRSPSTEPKILLDISSPTLLAFANPRPWVPQHMQTFVCWSSAGVKSGSDSQEEPPPHLSSWWQPLRDGHPYFRDPFMLYVSRYIPYLAFRREYTAVEEKELPIERRPVFYDVDLFDGVRLVESLVLTVALSPSHAFFLLGMLDGTILLMSPWCEDVTCDAHCETRSGGTPNNTVQSRTVSARNVSSCIGNRCRESADVTFPAAFVSAYEGREMDGVENEWDEVDSSDVAQTVSNQHAPVSHLYRTTLLRGGGRERARWHHPLRAFKALQLFGNGFVEDEYIRTLQSSVASAFDYVGGNGEMVGMPLHAIWVVAPNEQRNQSQVSGIWTMHLDDWKLTTLSTHYEVVVYDLSLQSVRSKNGVVFAALLTLSPYLHHPMNQVRSCGSAELWMCARIRKQLQVETKARATGMEINWQGGLLLVNSFFGVIRSSIFDFTPLFRDPDAAGKKHGAPVAYSATRREYRTRTCGADATAPTGVGVALPRHYPLLLRRELLLLLSTLIHPFTFLCGTAALFLIMLRMDEYIAIPHWISLVLYAPLALNILFGDFLRYDPYCIHGCGVPFVFRILSDVLMFVVFPVLFTLRRDAYDQFHPSWVLISLPLDLSIALAPVPSAYVTISQGKNFCGGMSFAGFYDYTLQALCIAFVVLLSLYFDGPSADDPEKPVFNIVIAFVPIFILFVLILVRSVLHLHRPQNRAHSIVLCCVVILLTIPALLFISQFRMYYASLSAKEGMVLSSLMYSLFVLPVLMLVLTIQFAFSTVMLLCN